MLRDPTHHLLSHLSLALAGVCLSFAELSYLPEMTFVLPVYLALVALSWHLGGRWLLPVWGANLLGLLIAVGAVLWVWSRVGADDSLPNWAQEISLPGVVVPYLGPVLMALTLVRLFRPAGPDDFWLLQGMGLLQVALGCVLANDTVFGLVLPAYMAAALCALAAHERARQAQLVPSSGQSASLSRNERGWLSFAARWVLAVGLLGWPLFLMTPRLEGPEWAPLERFGVTPPRKLVSHMGFSEEIDLKRTGRLERADEMAFTVHVTDAWGRPSSDLPRDQRWRGVVLDRYDEGIWRCELTFSGSAATPVSHGAGPPPQPGATALVLHFSVPGKTGSLFLADPVPLGSKRGAVPIFADPRRDSPIRVGRFFHEVGGTILPNPYLPNPEYHYIQYFDGSSDRERCPLVSLDRLPEAYQIKLTTIRRTGMGQWTTRLLSRLVNQPPVQPDLARVLAEPHPPGWYLPPNLWEPVCRRLTDYLAHSGEFTYTLHQRRQDMALDPVLDFLTNVKQGACERYAAALTLLLRSVGIPARIVKGYRGAEHKGEGHYLVRQSHAHAWVEALVPDRKSAQSFDWLALDPTPDADPPPTGWAQWWEQQQRSGEGLWRDLIVGYNARQQADLWEELTSGRLLEKVVPALLLVGVVVLLAWLGRRQLRRWRLAQGPGAAGTLYDRLLEVLRGRLRLRPRRGQTPRELAEEAFASLAQGPQTRTLAEVPHEVVELLYRARWGGQFPGPEELARVGGRLESLDRALVNSA
jgi:hypothetical protein